jgi:hypothetical protein
MIPGDAKVDLLILAVLWAASLAVVNPEGNFPLNDDWSFGTTVKNMMATGRFRPVQWASMPLLTQTLWGALFCLPTGFSFNALRLSSLVLSLCTTLGVYLLMRQVHPSRLLAALAALSVAFNPIFYALSCTFMTEVPFIALTVAAALFLLRNLQGGAYRDLLAGLACALAATLCRQIGLAVPVAFGACLLLSRGTAPGWAIRATIPPVVCLVALLGFQHWLRVTGRLPALYEMKNEALLATLRNPLHLALNLVTYTGTALLYLGCFSLPVMLAVLPSAAALRRNGRAGFIGCGAGCMFVLCSIIALVLVGNPLSKPSNIIQAQGIGPLTLRDVYILGLPHVATLGRASLLLATAAALLGGGFLFGALASIAADYLRFLVPPRLGNEQVTSMFLFLSAGLGLAPMLVVGGIDRYWLPALPFLLAGVAAVSSARIPAPKRWLLPTLLLMVLALFAVLGTRDYLAWNRVRWTALNELLATKEVTPEDVDGGFEFNGLYLYDPAYKEAPDKSWWWVHRDSYLLAFAEMPGWVVFKEYDYRRWLPPCTGRLLVLKKKSGPQGNNRNAAPADEHPGTRPTNDTR